jgi:hypothetical protein
MALSMDLRVRVLAAIDQGLIPTSHDTDSRGDSQSGETLTLWLPIGGHGHGCSDRNAERL